MSERSGEVAPGPGRGQDGGIHPLEVLAVALRGRRLILVTALIGAVLGVLAARLPPPVFRANGAFTPQESSNQSLSRLAGLAGQLGVTVPGAGTTESPEFYQELLGRRAILEPVLASRYETGEQVGSLLELAEIPGETRAERLDRGLEWFRESALDASVNRNTGVVAFSVETRWPDVSVAAARRILEELQRFNLETRQSQAQAERTFLQARLEEAEVELREAEAGLQVFLQQNRQFANSPELQFRHDRLQRQVTLRQQVYSGLLEAYEQARIQEVRNTPVITVVEEPVRPPRREARGTVAKTLTGLLLGAGLGLCLVLFRTATGAVGGRERDALGSAWRETVSDLRRVIPGRKTGGG